MEKGLEAGLQKAAKPFVVRTGVWICIPYQIEDYREAQFVSKPLDLNSRKFLKRRQLILASKGVNTNACRKFGGDFLVARRPLRPEALIPVGEKVVDENMPSFSTNLEPRTIVPLGAIVNQGLGILSMVSSFKRRSTIWVE